ncbi:MAG: hypothetical protein LBM87_04150 [Ruminococcus sp.]|jgi:hypothetical protein|nr:hypothetical protein [Ruminococcus sp.]
MPRIDGQPIKKQPPAFTALILLTAVFAIGVSIGVMLSIIYPESVEEAFLFISDGFLTETLGRSFIDTAVNSFTSAFTVLLLLFLLGFGAVFAPIMPLVLIYRGMGFGITLALMYISSGVRGVLMSLFTVIPFAVLSGLIHIIACRESMRMSASIFKVSSKEGFLPVDYRLYINKFIIMCALILIAALIQSALSYVYILLPISK